MGTYQTEKFTNQNSETQHPDGRAILHKHTGMCLFIRTSFKNFVITIVDTMLYKQHRQIFF